MLVQAQAQQVASACKRTGSTYVVISLLLLLLQMRLMLRALTKLMCLVVTVS
jgi:hypothetical protein